MVLDFLVGLILLDGLGEGVELPLFGPLPGRAFRLASSIGTMHGSCEDFRDSLRRKLVFEQVDLRILTSTFHVRDTDMGYDPAGKPYALCYCILPARRTHRTRQTSELQ